MSRHRTTPLEKKLGYHELPTGPNGRKLCRWCKVEVKPPKLTFCGKECVHQWKLRTDQGYMRGEVFKRDQGVCAGCGLDCRDIERRLNDWVWSAQTKRMEPPKDKELVLAWLRALGEKWRTTYWEADHIVPVSEGGGECGLENMRTLCVWCHKLETAALARRRAAARKTG